MKRFRELDTHRKDLEKRIADISEKMGASAVCLTLFNDSYGKDVDSLLQFALMIMMDKPFFLLVPKASKIPDHVLRMADGIEFYEPGDEASFNSATLKLMTQATSKGFVA